MGAAELERLFALYQSGGLSEQEYLAAKSRLLAEQSMAHEAGAAHQTLPQWAIPTVRINSTRTASGILALVGVISLFLPWYRQMSFLKTRDVFASMWVLPSWTDVMGLTLIGAMWASIAIPHRRMRSSFALLTGISGLAAINFTAGVPQTTQLWTIFNVRLLRRPAGREFIWERATQIDIGSLGALLFMLAALGVQTLAVWALLPRRQPDLLVSSRNRLSSVAQIAGLLLLYVSTGILNSSFLTWLLSVVPRG